jgi:Na+/glutamate symporter
MLKSLTITTLMSIGGAALWLLVALAIMPQDLALLSAAIFLAVLIIFHVLLPAILFAFTGAKRTNDKTNWS